MTKSGQPSRPVAVLDPQAGDLSHMRPAPLLTGLQLGSALLALAASVLVAYHFGATRSADAFFMGQSILLLFTKFLQSGPLPNLFVPLYIRVKRERGQDAAWTLFCNLFWAIAVVTVGLAAVLVAAGDLVVILIAPGFDPETKSVTAGVARVLFTTVVTLPLSTLVTAVFHARGVFVLPAAAALVPPSAYLAAVYWGAERYGIMALPWGILVGSLLQLVVLAAAVRFGVGLAWRWRPHWRQTELRDLVRQLMAFNLVVPFAEANVFVSRLILSLLPAGSMALIGYAERITTYLGRLYTLPTTFLPALARRLGQARGEEFKRFLAVNLNLANLIFFPASLGIMILSPELVTLLFERGAFGRDAAEGLGVVLALFMLGLLVEGMVALFNRTLYVVGRAPDIVKARIVANVVSVIAYLATFKVLTAYGVALIIGLGPVMFWMLYFRFLSRQVDGMVRLVFNASCARIALSTAIMGIVISLASRGLAGADAFHGAPLQVVAISGALGVAGYAVCLVLFRVSEAEIVRQYVASRLGLTWGRGTA